MTVVIKIGGARSVDPAGSIADVAALREAGREVVLVHGGSTAVDDTLEELGEEPTYVETPNGVVGRFTDERTMEVFTMVMPGKVNTGLVAALQNANVDAIGLSGVDGRLLVGKRKSAVRVLEDGKKKIKRGDHSGTIEEVNTSLLSTLLDAGYVPVVSLPVLGRESDGGLTAVNADADRVAAAVAAALEASLVLLTDVAGIYEDPADPTTRIDEVRTPTSFERVKAVSEGFMTKKVMAAEEALEGGAAAVIIGDANVPEPVTAALDGDGTWIDSSALEADDASVSDAGGVE